MSVTYKLTNTYDGSEVYFGFPVYTGIPNTPFDITPNVNSVTSGLSAYVDNIGASTFLLPSRSYDFYDAERNEFVYWGFQSLDLSLSGFNRYSDDWQARYWRGWPEIKKANTYKSENGRILLITNDDECIVYDTDGSVMLQNAGIFGYSEFATWWLASPTGIEDKQMMLVSGYLGLPEVNPEHPERLFPYGVGFRWDGNIMGAGSYADVFYLLFEGLEPEDEGDDPFKPDPQPEPTPGGYTPPGGDIIPEPTLPPVSVTDTGFVTLYNPTKVQLRNLASYMWSDAFSFNAFKKIIADPMDCILSLKLLPCPIPNTGVIPVTIGNINTGVNINNCPNQFISVDFGSVTLNRNTFSYLDWAPYTKVSIYLPFVGERQLDTNEVMGKSIQVKYHIDVLKGDGVAYILVNGCLFNQYDCHCSIDIPVNGKNTTGSMIGALSLIGQGAMAVATNGTSLITSMDSSASTVAGMKPQIQHSGNLGGSSGALSTRYPFLIVSRPKICAPANQNKYTGYPLFQTKRLSNVHGFTKIYECHIDNIPCTEEEKRMIESALKEGVILP